jgi:hypothetical protein
LGVCIDDEEQDGEIEFKLKKSTIGAAVAGKVYVTEDHLFIHVLFIFIWYNVGGLIGTVILGPFIGLLLAVGAGYTA